MESFRLILIVIVLFQQVYADHATIAITQKINDTWYANSFFGLSVKKPQGCSSATFNAMRESITMLDAMFENDREKLISPYRSFKLDYR